MLVACSRNGICQEMTALYAISFSLEDLQKADWQVSPLANLSCALNPFQIPGTQASWQTILDQGATQFRSRIAEQMLALSIGSQIKSVCSLSGHRGFAECKSTVKDKGNGFLHQCAVRSRRDGSHLAAARSIRKPGCGRFDKATYYEACVFHALISFLTDLIWYLVSQLSFI